MAAVDQNTVVSTDLTAARTIDFVSRFVNDINGITALLGDVVKSKRAAGTNIVVKRANVTLNNTAVGEGELVPYNDVNYVEETVGTKTMGIVIAILIAVAIIILIVIMIPKNNNKSNRK
mgnify:CR=1 FL=1